MVKSNICRRNISCSNTGWHLKRIWKTALHPMYGIVPRTLDTLIGFLESLYYIVTFPIVSVCCMFIIRSACFSEDWTTDALPEVKECLFNLYCWVIIAKIIEQSNHYVCRWHSFLIRIGFEVSVLVFIDFNRQWNTNLNLNSPCLFENVP